MPSEKFEQLLADYLDGTLDAAGRDALAAEMERDAQAAQVFDQAVSFEALLVAAHVEPPARESIAGGVRSRAEQALVLRSISWRGRVLAAAAAAVLVGAGLWAFHGLFTTKPAPPLPPADNQVLAGRVEADGVEAAGFPNGAKVKVLGNQPAEIRLADGSMASLTPKSEAVLRGPAGAVRQVVELQRGAGTFDVHKEPKQFKVETPVGSVTVMGTKFSVELQPREAKGAGEMKGTLSWALVVAVAAGTVEVNYGGKSESLTVGASKTFAEEGKKEEPKATLPESVRGFAGQVKGTVAAKGEKSFDLKVTEVLKTWEANKATKPADLVGLTITVTSPWVKVGDRMQQAGTRLAFVQKVQVGQDLTLEIKHSERDQFVITELTKEQAAWAKAGREEPRKEEPRKEPESVVGKKLVLSDRAAEATFTGLVAGRGEGGVLKIRIATAEDKRLPVGETVAFYPSAFEKIEDRMRPARAYLQALERVHVGDKVEGGAFFDEHPRLAHLTVTARGEGERRPEKRPEERKPEPPKGGGDEF